MSVEFRTRSEVVFYRDFVEQLKRGHVDDIELKFHSYFSLSARLTEHD